MTVAGLTDDEDVGPARPPMAQVCPKEPVQPIQDWPRQFAFEHGDLLWEGEDFQSDIAPIAEEHANRS